MLSIGFGLITQRGVFNVFTHQDAREYAFLGSSWDSAVIQWFH